MAAELGIGVRVRVGWFDKPPDWPMDPRLKTGVITGGPFFLEHKYDPYWRVRFDVGNVQRIAEFLLIPIDDDNDQTTRHERELVGERV